MWWGLDRHVPRRSLRTGLAGRRPAGGQKPCKTEARLAGFEPATHGLEVRCSIHLSYRRTSCGPPRRAPRRAAWPWAARPNTPLKSGRRDSNPRQPAWKAGALPTELHPPVHPGAPIRAVIGTRGFEPPTPCSQSRCATRLRHVPSTTLLRLRLREYSVPLPGSLTSRRFLHYTCRVHGTRGAVRRLAPATGARRRPRGSHKEDG